MRLVRSEHVGVRGFVQGKTIVAIRIRIYPIKPKPFSVHGRLVAVSANAIVVQAGGRRWRASLTRRTLIRVGLRPGKVGDLRSGDRVLTRLRERPGGLTALRIHVFHRKATGRRVQVRGNIVSVAAGRSIIVRSAGISYTIRITSGTRVYLGNRAASRSNLKTGQNVRIYACCAGGTTLKASSIHIRKSRAHRSAFFVKGIVRSLSRSQIQVAAGRRTVRLSLNPSTRYEAGSSPVRRRSVHLSDHVSIRGFQSGTGFVATRVHVYAIYRRSHSLSGVVVASGSRSISIRTRGRVYTIRLAKGATVTRNGLSSSLSSAREGDRVRASGGLQGRTLNAKRVALRQVRAKLHTLRGVVTRIKGSNLVVVDALGASHSLRLAPGLIPTLHGRPAPASALFTGTRVTARGHISGRVFIASRLTLTVQERTVKGKVLRLGRGSFSLGHGTSQSVVHVPAGVNPVDGGRRIKWSQIQAGTYLQVHGYVEASKAIHATSGKVLHPQLVVTGAIAWVRDRLRIQNSQGAVVQVALNSATQLATGLAGLPFTASQIPDGARVRISGRVQTSGMLLAGEIRVHLKHEALRVKLKERTGGGLTVEAAGGQASVQIGSYTRLTQGSHTFALDQLVPGDDLSISGYEARFGILLARTIVVHRPRIALDGVIASLDSAGFVLATDQGSFRVIVNPATIVTTAAGASASVRARVHVSGYRRGDGVILATRLHIRKPK